MIAAEFFQALAGLSGVLFVITSMLAMGLSLTMPMILQPLKNARLVVLALVANFMLVRLLAYAILLLVLLPTAKRMGARMEVSLVTAVQAGNLNL